MRLVFTIISLLFPLMLFGQVTVAKSDPCDEIVSMNMGFIKVNKCGEEYHFIYRDITYEHIIEYKSFWFKDEDQALQTMFNLIMEGFDDPNRDRVTLEFPDDIVVLSYPKYMGKQAFQFIHFVDKTEVTGQSSYMTKKNITKLFNKIIEK